MRICLQRTFIILTLLFASTISYGIEIISDPIIEGKSIAGLRIGDTEDKISAVLHKRSLKLVYVRYLEANEKLMDFANLTEEGGEESGLVIDVVLRSGTVVNIAVVSAPMKGKHFYSGKTKKGFSFGDSFEVVEKLYGKPHRKMHMVYWYKKEGIIFQAVGEDVFKPNVIIIMPPGSEITRALKYRYDLIEIGR
jgi:hypothetical protein